MILRILCDDLKRVIANDSDLMIHEVADTTVFEHDRVAAVGVHARVANVEQVAFTKRRVDGYQLVEFVDLIEHVHLDLTALIR